MRNKFICLSLVFVLAMSFVNFGFCAVKPLVFVGGQMGGSYQLHGSALVEIVHRTYPEIFIDYRPGGGVANVMNLSKGEFDLGFTHNVVAKAGMLGIEPFKEKQSGIMAICTTYGSKVQVVTLADSGVDSISQIKEEKMPVRISVGDHGGATELCIRRMLEAYGITYNDVISWGGKVYYKQMAEANEMMLAGRLDIQFNSGACPLAVFKQLASTRDVKLLSIDEKAIEEVSKKYGYVRTLVTPDHYDFVTEDSPTIGVLTTVIVREDIPEEIVYKITRAIAENLDYFYNVDVSLKTVTKETMCKGTGVELHPGAKRYYREIGVIKE